MAVISETVGSIKTNFHWQIALVIRRNLGLILLKKKIGLRKNKIKKQ